MTIEEDLLSVGESLANKKIVTQDPLDSNGGVIYFQLKHEPMKAIALKAVADDEYWLTVFAEIILADKRVNYMDLWIYNVQVGDVGKHTIFYPIEYGRLFENIFVWHKDVDSTVNLILETIPVGTHSQVSQYY